MPDEDRPFNRAEVLELLDGDVETALELVQLLTTSLPGYLDSLRSAIAAADWKGVSFHAHAIKGAISNVAAHDLVAQAQQLERVAKGAAPGEALILVAPFDASGRKLQAALEAWAHELEASALASGSISGGDSRR
jgi:HPt (histidine-containing phosphotransfer) domain-containing protein